jgi:hypothetical protein
MQVYAEEDACMSDDMRKGGCRLALVYADGGRPACDTDSGYKPAYSASVSAEAKGRVPRTVHWTEKRECSTTSTLLEYLLCII